MNNIPQIELPATIAIYGPPGGGKTVAAKALLAHYADRWDNIWVICQEVITYEYNRIRAGFLHAEYDESVITDIIQSQTINGFPPGVILFDLVLHQMNFRSNALRNLMTRHQELNLTLIFCCSYTSALDEIARGRIRYTFVTKFASASALKIIRKDLLVWFDKWRDIRDLMATMPEHGFIFGDRHSQCNNYQICVFTPDNTFGDGDVDGEYE